jgi:hypothetical protein
LHASFLRQGGAAAKKFQRMSELSENVPIPT